MIELQRATDAVRLNEIVNHPSIYPHVRGAVEGPLDLTMLISDPRHVALVGEHGAVIFIQHQLGLYEAHTNVLPEGRGQWTLELGQAALHWMFTHTDAVELMTRVPKGNFAARAGARAIGAVFDFRADPGYIADGKPVPADLFSLQIQQWIRTAPGLVEAGEWFHETIASEYRRIGKEEAIHEEDQDHNRHAGAAVEMIRGGQVMKGVIFFNRYASMVGHQTIKLVAMEPITIDIREAVLEVHGQHFFIQPQYGAPISTVQH